MRRNARLPDQRQHDAIYGLVGAYGVLRETPWVSNGQFHTTLEVIATTLALFVGVMALTRYYSQKR